MNPKKIKIESSWKAALSEEFTKPYFIDLIDELLNEKKNGNFYAIFKFTVASSRCLFVNHLNKTPIQCDWRIRGLRFG